MVFRFQNCSDLLREKIGLVIVKSFWNSRLKAKNLQHFWDHYKKGNRILRYGCRAFDTFWVPDDIESCNFQNLLIFGFHETSQNLMSFRQLLFLLFHGGDQREKSENLRNLPKRRQSYPTWPHYDQALYTYTYRQLFLIQCFWFWQIWKYLIHITFKVQ